MLNATKTILDFFVKRVVIQNCNNDFLSIDFTDEANFIPLNEIFVGSDCSDSIDKIASYDEKYEVLLNLRGFYSELIKQICNRFDFTDVFIKNCSFIDPISLTDQNSNVIVALAREFGSQFTEEQLSNLEIEFRELKNLESLPSENTQNLEVFWHNIFVKHKTSFHAIKRLVDLVLILPHSSANVERAFSTVNLNKTKSRNKLDNCTLEGILHTKSFLSLAGQECISFQENTSMIKLYNANIYS